MHMLKRGSLFLANQGAPNFPDVLERNVWRFLTSESGSKWMLTDCQPSSQFSSEWRDSPSPRRRVGDLAIMLGSTFNPSFFFVVIDPEVHVV